MFNLSALNDCGNVKFLCIFKSFDLSLKVTTNENVRWQTQFPVVVHSPWICTSMYFVFNSFSFLVY